MALRIFRGEKQLPGQTHLPKPEGLGGMEDEAYIF